MPIWQHWSYLTARLVYYYTVFLVCLGFQQILFQFNRQICATIYVEITLKFEVFTLKFIGVAPIDKLYRNVSQSTSTSRWRSIPIQAGFSDAAGLTSSQSKGAVFLDSGVVPRRAAD